MLYSSLDVNEVLHQGLFGRFAEEPSRNRCHQLGAEGLQSDRRYAENYIRMRSGKGYGPQKIRVELGERGISTDLIDNALSDSEIDWREQAERVRSKKFGVECPQDWNERSRQMRFLQYRGFTTEQIQDNVTND